MAKRNDSGVGATPSNPTYTDSDWPSGQQEVMDDTNDWIECIVAGDPEGRQNDDIEYGENNNSGTVAGR